MKADFIVPDRTEQMFGGGVKPLLNNRGRRLAKVFSCCLISLSMLAMLTGCSSGGTNATEKDQQAADYETQKATTATETTQAETETEFGEIEQFGDTIDPFQGEWKQTGNDYVRLIISDKDLNFVYESSIGEKEFCDVQTFYFAIDEAGQLIVVNQYSQPRKTATIDENGLLTVESLTGGETETYEKFSDNTEIPAEKVKPEIGMSESEVYDSTWGAPKEKNTTTTVSGEREQWVYDSGYIYFEGGYVTSIQEVQP